MVASRSADTKVAIRGLYSGNPASVESSRLNEENNQIPSMAIQPDAIRGPLRSCGYRSDLLRSDFRYGDNASAPLVGFAQVPMDSRSACVAVLTAIHGPRAAVEACRPLGAPIVLMCFDNHLQWWKQGVTSAEWIESIPSDRIDNFFQRHQKDFSPEAVYRAKTLGRVRSEYQLSFVDLGLMPLVEKEVGEALGNLIERNVSGLKSRLRWSHVTDEQGHWLLKAVFWLVSAKILKDKRVPSFDDIAITNVEEVFSRLAKHYGTTSFQAGSAQKLAALQESARIIGQFSSLALTTTESLGYVYENTLISKQTRASLGTHCTPSFLVDYIVGRLADWIEEIPENDRSVFEPACGHAAFLVAAMRLLAQLLPYEKSIPSRRGPYLRSRLHGTDRDPFALELARLSLTLSDIPNPNGWDLRIQDMFVGNKLAEQTRGKSIFLANPPFENFENDEISAYATTSANMVVNKAAEMLRRTLPQLQPGSVFGVVVPQTILHGRFAEEVRHFLVEHFELREVSLFPDKVFKFSDAESAILLGRRRRDKSRKNTKLTFRRIRERQMPKFRECYDAASSRVVEQNRFDANVCWDLRVPDLEDVWLALKANPKASDFAELMQGLAYKGKDLPPDVITYSDERFPGALQGFLRFENDPQIHQIPKLFWMNLADEAILHRRSGTTVGTPQVLVNYAPVGRGPWRLKAFIDRRGRPVASRFITARSKSYSLEVLWSLLNSPVANAFVYTHSGKRDNLVSDMRRIPMPEGKAFGEIETAARNYLDAAVNGAASDELCKLILIVDAAVLREYSLPPQLEGALLSLFTGWDRVGVPFKQDHYFPPELTHLMGFSDFVDYESNWPSTNRRRGKLIAKEIDGSITSNEAIELAGLQAYADYYIDKVSPRPTEVISALEDQVFGIAASRKKGV